MFEFWQANLSTVLLHHEPLLDRLANMGATYVVGNHDIDLLHFCDPKLTSRIKFVHPFFKKMHTEAWFDVKGVRWKFIHGHRSDPACSSNNPGLGRISAIYSALKEDQNGSPFRNKVTVESQTVGRIEWLIDMWRWCTGRLSRQREIYSDVRAKHLTGPDRPWGVVMGHTHQAGRAGSQTLNCGTWAEDRCSFVRIQGGAGQVYDWVNGAPKINTTGLLGSR
jgi:UDP-2,3-diacylglucosamine pyrophosphatase LpxH